MPDDEPAPAANVAPPRAWGGDGGLRIAQKLFLSYVLPLAVLIVAGLALPFVLWSYFGRFVEDYNGRVQFADRAVAWRRIAIDTEQQARGYVLSQDPVFEAQFQESKTNFGAQYRNLADYLEARPDAGPLRDGLGHVNQSYRAWLRTTVHPLIRAVPQTRRGSGLSNIAASRIRGGFISVHSDMDAFVLAANEYRNREQERARGFDVMRKITSVAIPVTSVLLAMLIGRSIALGITRPLEALTRATEALEAGDPNPLLLAGQEEPPPGDEIGDLQRAFQRMARTIRQREAVLRAQNEALEALNRRTEAVLNSTNDGILMLDRAGGFSMVNERFANLFGLEAETIRDHTFEQAAPLLLARFKNKTQAREQLEAILHDPDAVAEETFDIVEPVARTLRVYTAPVHGDPDEDGTPELLGRIFAFRDVTRETIVDRMKTEFVSTVSHELRTPLTAIKGYVDLMVGGQTGPMNPVQTEFLTMVQVSTKRLTALINDMLDISRIESGRMEMRRESVDYVPLLRQTVRMMENEAATRNIALSLEVAGEDGRGSFPPVVGDADRITQVLVNFLSNGIKYTTPGGRVTVRVEFEDEFVTTCVEDTGIGISDDDQRKLFQKFFRADNSTTREVGGTGLGLAITKAILEKLNGSVWVESTPGQGSRFYFTLPTVALKRGANGAPALPAGPQPLVLSIDGDVAALHRLGHELRHQGFVAANAGTEALALRRARDLRPDIITLNPLSAAFDAFDLLRRLRAMPGTQDTPVVFAAVCLGDTAGTLRDTDAFLLHSADGDAFQKAVRDALPAQPEDAPGARPVVLVLGNAELAGRVRAALAGCGPCLIVPAGTPDAAENELGGHHPDALVFDSTQTPASAAGTLLMHLERRRAGRGIAVVGLVEDGLLDANTRPLVPFGAGGVPLERVGRVLGDILHDTENATEDRAGTPAAAAAPAGKGS